MNTEEMRVEIERSQIRDKMEKLFIPLFQQIGERLYEKSEKINRETEENNKSSK